MFVYFNVLGILTERTVLLRGKGALEKVPAFEYKSKRVYSFNRLTLVGIKIQVISLLVI